MLKMQLGTVYKGERLIYLLYTKTRIKYLQFCQFMSMSTVYDDFHLFERFCSIKITFFQIHLNTILFQTQIFKS